MKNEWRACGSSLFLFWGMAVLTPFASVATEELTRGSESSQERVVPVRTAIGRECIQHRARILFAFATLRIYLEIAATRNLASP